MGGGRAGVYNKSWGDTATTKIAMGQQNKMKNEGRYHNFSLRTPLREEVGVSGWGAHTHEHFSLYLDFTSFVISRPQ